MAVLTADERTDLRQTLARVEGSPNYTKPQVDAAFQAIRAFFEDAATRTALGQAIEGAAPGVFNAAQKTRIVKIYLATAERRDGS